MIYWSIFILLLYFSINEYKSRKRNINAFKLIYLIIGALLCLRQGQGTDYYNYYQIFKEVQYYSDRSFLLIFAMRDPLYSLMNWLFIKIGLSYPWFIAFFASITMIIQWYFFRIICKGSCISLFIFYSTIVIPYDFNAMRQGLALAIVLGIIFPLMLKRKYTKFVIVSVLTCLIHLSVFICLLLPVAYRMNLKKGTMAFVVLCCVIFIFSGGSIISHMPLPGFLAHRAASYTVSASTQLFAIANRLVLLIPLFIVPDSIYQKNGMVRLLRNIILLGFIVYAAFSFNDFIASRENIYFRVFECYFISIILLETSLRINRKYLLSFYIFMSGLLFTKEISSSIAQGRYINCNVFTYPYFSIVEDINTIQKYRTNFGDVDEAVSL